MGFGYHHDHRHHHHHHHAVRRLAAMRGGGGAFGMGWDMDERPGRGRRRLFDGGELRLVLLRLIGDQPRHGYDLIRAIEERTGGAYAPSPGVVYPTVTLLADMDLIAEAPSEGAGTRRLYRVTDEGQRTLDTRAEEIAALMARLDAIGEARGRAESQSVRRAVGNLRIALRDRLDRDAAPETVHAIVALIDALAQKVERL